MANLLFDKNGFLQPAEAMPADLDFLEKNFVEPFPESATRRQLFENYRQFVADLQREVFPYFEQWVNGSFVSQKLNPKDLDVVTFLDWRVLRTREAALEPFWSDRLEHLRIDSWFVPVFPDDHEQHSETQKNRLLWSDFFGHSRKKGNQKRPPKGFLHLTFEKEI